MPLKEISRIILRQPHSWSAPAVLLATALACSFSLSGGEGPLRFLSAFNGIMPAFLIHAFMIPILFLPVDGILYNDMLRTRAASHLAVYGNRIKAAAILSALYCLCKWSIEIVFLWITGETGALDATLCLLYLLQFGTILFACLFLLMLKELFRRTSAAVLVYCFVFGADLFLSMMPIAGAFFDIHLFCVPMALPAAYADILAGGEGTLPLLFHVLYLLVKIVCVTLAGYLLAIAKRRERFVKA